MNNFQYLEKMLEKQEKRVKQLAERLEKEKIELEFIKGERDKVKADWESRGIPLNHKPGTLIN